MSIHCKPTAVAALPTTIPPLSQTCLPRHQPAIRRSSHQLEEVLALHPDDGRRAASRAQTARRTTRWSQEGLALPRPRAPEWPAAHERAFASGGTPDWQPTAGQEEGAREEPNASTYKGRRSVPSLETLRAGGGFTDEAPGVCIGRKTVDGGGARPGGGRCAMEGSRLRCERVSGPGE
ncbi:hypothetical protein ACCO45_006717 [Purpureocillium lilacinum]|uniref:Uncharacterized protein n=1 Tax=Purpureocillium lilacinum TaxID=33203 RepID=A0ACC4DQB0_PURLI